MEVKMKTKVESLKTYLPFVNGLINKLELKADNNQKEHLERLKGLQKFLINPDIRGKNIETLERMECLIQGMYKSANKSTNIHHSSDNHERRRIDKNRHHRLYKEERKEGHKSREEKYAKYSKSKSRHGEMENTIYSRKEDNRRIGSYDTDKHKYDRRSESQDNESTCKSDRYEESQDNSNFLKKDNYRENQDNYRSISKARSHLLFGDDDVPINQSKKDLHISEPSQSRNSGVSLLDLPMPPQVEKHSNQEWHPSSSSKKLISKSSSGPILSGNSSYAAQSRPLSIPSPLLKGEYSDNSKVGGERIKSSKYDANKSSEPSDPSNKPLSSFTNFTSSKSEKLRTFSSDSSIHSSGYMVRTNKSVSHCLKPTDIPLPTYPNRPFTEDFDSPLSPEKEAPLSPSYNDSDSLKGKPSFAIKNNNNNNSPDHLPAPKVNVEVIQKALNFIYAVDKSKKPEQGQGVSYRYEDFVGPASTSSSPSNHYDPEEMWSSSSAPIVKEDSKTTTFTGRKDVDLRFKRDTDLRKIPGPYLKSSLHSVTQVHSSDNKQFGSADVSPTGSNLSTSFANINLTPHHENKDVDMRSIIPAPINQQRTTVVSNKTSSSLVSGNAKNKNMESGKFDSVRSRFEQSPNEIIKLGYKGVAASQLETYKQKREKYSTSRFSQNINMPTASSPAYSGPSSNKETKSKERVSVLDELLPESSINNAASSAKGEIAGNASFGTNVPKERKSDIIIKDFEKTNSSFVDASEHFGSNRYVDSEKGKNREISKCSNFKDPKTVGNIDSKYGSQYISKVKPTPCNKTLNKTDKSFTYESSGSRDPRISQINIPQEPKLMDSYSTTLGSHNLDKIPLIDHRLASQNRDLPLQKDPRLNISEVPSDPRMRECQRDPRVNAASSPLRLPQASRGLAGANNFHTRSSFPFNSVHENSKFGMNYGYSSDRSCVNNPAFRMPSQPSRGFGAAPLNSGFKSQKRSNPTHQSQSSNSAIRDSFTCLIMQGLPHFTNSSHIYRYFEEYILRDMCIELDESYNCKGTAYIYFPNHLSAKKALEMENGKSLLNYDISLGICSVGILNQAKRVYDMQNRDREQYLNIPPKPFGNGNPFYKPKPIESPTRPPVAFQAEISLPSTSISEEKLKNKDSESSGYSQLCATKLDGESGKVLQNFKIPKLRKTDPVTEENSALKSNWTDNASNNAAQIAVESSLVTSTKLLSSDSDSEELLQPVSQCKKNRRRRIRIDSDSDSDSGKVKDSLKVKKTYLKKTGKPVMVSKTGSESNGDIDNQPSDKVNFSESVASDQRKISNKNNDFSIISKTEKSLKGSSILKKLVGKIKDRATPDSSKMIKNKIGDKLPAGKMKNLKTLKSLTLISDVPDIGTTKFTRQKHEVFKDIFPFIKKYQVIIPIPKKYVYSLTDEVKHVTGKRPKKVDYLAANSSYISNCEASDYSDENLLNNKKSADPDKEYEELPISVFDNEHSHPLKECSNATNDLPKSVALNSDNVASDDAVAIQLNQGESYDCNMSFVEPLISVKVSANNLENERPETVSRNLTTVIDANNGSEWHSNKNESLGLDLECEKKGPLFIDKKSKIQKHDNTNKSSSKSKEDEIKNTNTNLSLVKLKEGKSILTSEELSIQRIESETLGTVTTNTMEYIPSTELNAVSPVKENKIQSFRMLINTNKSYSQKNLSKSLFNCEEKDGLVKCKGKRKNEGIAYGVAKKHKKSKNKWQKGYKPCNILNLPQKEVQFSKKRSYSLDNENDVEQISKRSYNFDSGEKDNPIVIDDNTSPDCSFDLEDTESTDLRNITPSLQKEIDIFETLATSSCLVDIIDHNSGDPKTFSNKDSNEEEKKCIKLISEELVETANKFTEKKSICNEIKLFDSKENNSLVHEEEEEFSISYEVNQLVESLDQSFSDPGSAYALAEMHLNVDPIENNRNFVNEKGGVNMKSLNTASLGISNTHDSLSAETNFLTENITCSGKIMKETGPTAQNDNTHQVNLCDKGKMITNDLHAMIYEKDETGQSSKHNDFSSAETCMIEQRESITGTKSVVQEELIATETKIIGRNESLDSETEKIDQHESVTTEDNNVDQNESVSTEDNNVDKNESVTTEDNNVHQNESVKTEDDIVDQNESVTTEDNNIDQNESVTTEDNNIDQNESVTTEDNNIDQNESVYTEIKHDHSELLTSTRENLHQNGFITSDTENIYQNKSPPMDAENVDQNEMVSSENMITNKNESMMTVTKEIDENESVTMEIANIDQYESLTSGTETMNQSKSVTADIKTIDPTISISIETKKNKKIENFNEIDINVGLLSSSSFLSVPSFNEKVEKNKKVDTEVVFSAVEEHESDIDDVASVGVGSVCSINDDVSIISSEDRDICTPDSLGKVAGKKLKKDKVSQQPRLGHIERRRITRGTLVVPKTETILWNDGGCVDLFQCDQCDYVGKHRVSHLVNFHSEREIPCHFRKEDFSPVLKDSLGPLYPKSSKIVKLNLSKVPKQMVFDSEIKCKASDCDYISSNRFDFIYHLLEHKPDAVASMSHCRLCNFMTDNLEELYDHVASHTGEYRHTCERCGQRAFSVEVLKHHHKDYHGQQSEQFTSENMVLEDKWPYIYVCRICHYVQIHAKNIEDHNKMKHNGKADIVKANMSRNVVIHSDSKKELEITLPKKSVIDIKSTGTKIKRKKFNCYLRKLKKGRKKASIKNLSQNDQESFDNTASLEKESNDAFSDGKDDSAQLEHPAIEEPQLIVKKVTNIPVFLGQEDEKEVDIGKHVDQLVDRIMLNQYTSRSSSEIKRKISSLDDILKKVDQHSAELVDHDDDEDLTMINIEKKVVNRLNEAKKSTVIEKKIELYTSILDESIEVNKNLYSFKEKKDKEHSLAADYFDNYCSKNTLPLSDVESSDGNCDWGPQSSFQTSPEKLTNLISRLKTNLEEKSDDRINVEKYYNATSEQDNSDSDNQLVICEDEEEESVETSRSTSPTASNRYVLQSSSPRAGFKSAQVSEIKDQETGGSGLKFISTYDLNQRLAEVTKSKLTYPDSNSDKSTVINLTTIQKPHSFSHLPSVDNEDDVDKSFLKIQSYGTLDPTEASQLFKSDTEDTLQSTSKVGVPLVNFDKASKSFSSVSAVKNLDQKIYGEMNKSYSMASTTGMASVLKPIAPKVILAGNTDACITSTGLTDSKTNINLFPHLEGGETLPAEPPTVPLMPIFVKYQTIEAFNYYTVSKASEVFKCMVQGCVFVTEITDTFQKHMEQHLNTKLFRCCYCFLKCMTAKILVQHIIDEHSHCQFQCKYCLYRAYTKVYLGVHLKKFHPRNEARYIKVGTIKTDPPANPPIENFVHPYKCTFENCTFRTVDSDAFKSHVKTHGNNFVLQCLFCDVSDSVEAIVKHMNVHMMNEYQCPYCLFGEAEREKLLTHLLNCHPGRPGKVLLRKQVSSSPAPVISTVPPSSVPLSHSTVTGPELSSATPSIQSPSMHCLSRTAIAPVTTTSNVMARSQGISSTDHKINAMSPITDHLSLNSASKTILSEFTNPLKSTVPIAKEKSAAEIALVKLPATKYSSVETPAENIQEDLTIPLRSAADQNSSVVVAQPFSRESTSDQIGLVGNALYRCGNEKCSFSCDTQLLLKEHLQVCDFSRDSPLLKCFHCCKSFRHLSGLLEHIKVHGPKKYICGVEACEYRSTLLHSFKNHMKQVHHNGSYRSVHRDFSNKNPETQEFLVYPKDIVTNIREPHKKRKNEFSIEDFDKMPHCHISYSDLKCYHCTYSTKVRLNLVKHLQLHKKLLGHITQSENSAEVTKIIPAKQPTNPVPRLASTELMFDKMMNLAGSSVEDKKKLEENDLRSKYPIPQEELEQLPMYIPDEKLNLCGIKGCNYQSCDETMLKYHIETLHSEVDFFLCPHCPNYTITLDGIGNHFRLHGERLYRCGWCSYLTTRLALVERHSNETHPMKTSFHFTIRETDSKELEDSESIELQDDCLNENSMPNLQEDSNLHEKSVNQGSVSVSSSNLDGDPLWQCGNCTFRSVTLQEMQNHATIKHEVKHQYKCGYCNMKSSVPTTFNAHYAAKHPDQDFKVLCMFYRLDSNNIEPLPPGGSTTSHEPLWRRNDPDRKKMIRGILLEENSDKEDATLLTDPENEEFICPKCYSFKTPCVNTFRSHLCKESNYQRFECKECGITNPLLPSLRRHYTKTHGMPFTADSYFNLPVDIELDAWVESIITHQEHLINLHKETKEAYKTPKEDESKGTIVRRSSLVGPAESLSLVEQEPQASVLLPDAGAEKGKFACTLCDVECRNAAGLKSHTAAFHQTKIKCQFCSFSSKTEFGLKRHCSKKHSNIENNEESKNESQLSEPVTYKHECSLCSFKTNSSNSFYTHNQTHPEVRDYVCGYCNSRFANTRAANLHSYYRHSSETPKIIFLPLAVEEAKEAENLLSPVSEIKVVPVYACFHCNEKGSFPLIEEHMKAKHSDLTFCVRKETGNATCIELYKYKCNFCTNDSSSLQDAVTHWMKNHVTLDFKFSLSLCSSNQGSSSQIGKDSNSPITGKSMVCSKVMDNTMPVVDPSQPSLDSSISLDKSMEGNSDVESDQTPLSSSEKDCVIKCGYCRKINSKKSVIQEHIKLAHEGKPSRIHCFKKNEYARLYRGLSKCNYCGEIGTLTELQKHSTTEHPDINPSFSKTAKPSSSDKVCFRCDHCSHVVKNLKSIKNHLKRTHLGLVESFTRLEFDSPLQQPSKLPFKCNYCGDKVATQQEMDDHHQFMHSHLPHSCTNVMIEALQTIHGNSPSSSGSDKARVEFDPTSSTPSEHFLPHADDSFSGMAIISLKNTARKSFSSSAAHQQVKRQIATKSTSGRRLQLAFLKSPSSSSEEEEDEDDSFFSSPSSSSSELSPHKEKVVDSEHSEIYANLKPLGGTSSPLSFSKLSELLDLNPKVKIVDFRKTKYS